MSRAQLPAGALRLLATMGDEEEPRPLAADEQRVAEVLAARGYCALLPGCRSTYGLTDAGRATLPDDRRRRQRRRLRPKQLTPKQRAALAKPWIGNYEPLDAWLKKHGAHCNYQLPIGDPEAPRAYVENWQVGRGQVVVVVFADQLGWELYTAGGSSRVDETFQDAERRLGIEPEAPRT